MRGRSRPGVVADERAYWQPEEPVSPLGKLGMTLGAMIGGGADPTRGDLVALFGETTSAPVLAGLVSRVQQHPVGSRMMNYRQNPITFQPPEGWSPPSEPLPSIWAKYADVLAGDVHPLVAYCASLPPESFGGAYAEFMLSHGYDPRSRTPVKFIADDPEGAWVMGRYRHIHDFLHVLTNLPTTVLGELGLKVYEYQITGLPSTWMSRYIGPQATLSAEERAYFHNVLEPWGVRVGSKAVDFLCVDFEGSLEQPLTELRAELGIEPAADLPESLQQPGSREHA